MTFALGVAFVVVWLPAQLGAQSLVADHPTYRTVENVYDDLVRAIGDGRAAPTLSILPRGIDAGMKVAWFSPGSDVLHIEERAFDLCRRVGADSLNALAALLGHELAHYYKDHDWPGDFGNGYADLEVGQRIRQLERATERLVEYESEADYFGGFFGYVAGYNTLGVTPALLRLVYDEYELDATIPGYPSLADRQEIASRSQHQLAALVPAFDAGRQLLLLHEHDTAALCFDFISRTFPSREVLNNAGVARALEAQRLFRPGELRFAYPFELDARSRLRRDTEDYRSGFADAHSERRIHLLQEAAELFAKAQARDRAYAAAIVNLASVAELSGNADAAVLHAEQAMAVANAAGDSLSLANAFIIRGIARAGEDLGEVDLARADFEEARQGNRPLAETNLAIIDGVDGRAVSVDDSETRSAARERTIGPGTRAFDEIASHGVVTIVPVGAPGRSDVVIMTKPVDGFDGVIIDAGVDQGTVSLMSTRRGYGGQTARGIEVGSRFEELLPLYGQPTRLVAGRQATYCIYEKVGISFRVDDQGTIAGWTLFSKEREFYEPVTELSQQLNVEPRVALVVGNSGYSEAPLRNTVHDAIDMTKALEECGFEVVQRIDADRRNMRRAIRDFGTRLKAGGVGLFYYAGHGVQVNGQNYLVPVSADVHNETDVVDEGVRVASVLEYMENAQNRINIVILDACRNNPYARQFRSGSSGLASINATTAVRAVSGALVAYSTGPGMVAADGEGENGLYTQKLLQFMKVPGLTIEQVFKSVAREVTQATDNGQTPWQSNSLTGDFYFLPPVAAQGFARSPPPPAVAFGHLQVNVNAGEASVFVDDRSVGFARMSKPLELPNVGLGTVAVRVEAAGFDPQTHRHELSPNEWTAAVFALRAKPVATASSPARNPAIGEMLPVTDFDFYIDAYEVTNREFAAFLNGQGNREEGGASWLDVDDEDALVEPSGGGFAARPGFEDHPVVEVTWYGAESYCGWQGKRLPSASEWKQAAFGTDGRHYPWGNEEPGSPAGFRANYYQGGLTEDGYAMAAPVGSYPQGVSPYGAYDMAGNVWEWVAGSDDIVMGGSYDSDEAGMGTSTTADRSLAMPDTGFRCAR